MKLYRRNIQNKKQKEQDITHCLLPPTKKKKKIKKRAYRYDIICLHQNIITNLNYEERSKILKRSVLFQRPQK